jgi:YVTN family beta-propeller protein
MGAIVTALNDADVENVAAYFSSLGPIGVPHVTPKLLASDKAGQTEFPETVFISMKKSGTVETFPQQVSWVGGPNMLYTAVTPDGTRIISSSPSTNSVYIFEATSGKQLAIVAVGKAPKGVKISPDGIFAYVSNEGSADISVINLDTLVVVDNISVENGPHNVRFTKDGKTAYVTLQGGAGIGVINTTTRKMFKVIPVPGITGPHNLDLSVDETTAFVRDVVHNVAVLDLLSEKVLKVIEVGKGHGGIDVAPNGKYVVTAAVGDNIISVIDVKNLTVKDIVVGNGPHGVRASIDSQWIYVTVTQDNSVVVVNANTLQVEKKIAVGEFPFWVAVQGNP